MQTQQLQAGVIYQFSELLPIHSSSVHYVRDARVIPDNTEWYKVECSDGFFAFHKTEKSRLLFVKDVHGIETLRHKRYSHYVTACDNDGNEIFFADEAAAEANDYKFSLRLKEFRDKKSSSFYGYEKTLTYHNNINDQESKHCPSFVNENDEYIVGLEIEKVDEDLREKSEAWRILQETGFRKETDGSLNSGGYELVSPKLPLLDTERIKKAMLPVIDLINGQSDTSCGGHINISRKNTHSHDLLKGLKGFVPILYAMYENRLTNRYCQAKKWNIYFTNPDKYSAFYLKNSKVLEIRIFSRVANYNTLMWRVKLMQLIVGDFGRNLNQFLLKLSSTESLLYKTMREQYSHEKIAEKITLAAKLSERYGCGKVSNSIAKRINDRFGFTVIAIS